MLIMRHLRLIITVISKGKLSPRNAFCDRKTFIHIATLKTFSSPLACWPSMAKSMEGNEKMLRNDIVHINRFLNEYCI